MAFLKQIEYLEPALSNVYQDPYEPAQVECGRLIHAAVISRRFLDGLLTNPVKTINEGYCGEKFAFTHEEKQRIKLIRARNLADFSTQLMQVIAIPVSIIATNEMAIVR